MRASASDVKNPTDWKTVAVGIIGLLLAVLGAVNTYLSNQAVDKTVENREKIEEVRKDTEAVKAALPK